MKRKMKPLVYSTISALVISMCSGTAAFAGEYTYTGTSMAVADVIGSLNIREYASEDSHIVGTLFAGSGAEVIENYGEWSLISSGDVTGYVKTQFLAFGESADALASVYGVPGNVMEANYTGAPVYAEADFTSAVMGSACEGQQLEVASNDGVFAEVILFDGSTGYMALTDLSYVPVLDTAVANENYVPQTYTEDYSADTYDVQNEYYGETYYDDTYIPETPTYETEAPVYETEAPVYETEAPQTEPSIDVSADDLNLLAAIIYCEAGNQSREGKVAVGAVVMNRVASSLFPNTIYDVIYQSGQFTPASSGALANALANGVPDDCVEAAQAALNGENPVGGALYFNTGSGQGMQIGDHQFY